MPVPESSLLERPENSLLLQAARVSIGDPTRLRIAATRVEDWPRVERLAGWHGLSPLLYHHLSLACPESVPRDVLDRLRDEYLLNSRRSLVQVGELLGVLDILNAHGIDAVPYKGPVTAAMLYENPAFRVAGDLDLLVRPTDVLAARQALESADYRPSFQLSAQQDSAYREHAVGYSLISPHHATIVDLQWELSPKRFSFRPPVESFRSRLIPIDLQRTDVETFCPNDMLLVLCLHGSKHVWESLKWLVDVAELVRRYPELDYEGTLADARGAGCVRAVHLGLLLASRLLDAPVPSSIVAAAESDATVRWMADCIRRRTFDSAPTREGKARIEMRLEDSVIKQVRYILRRLWTPRTNEWTGPAEGAMGRARRPLQLIWFLIARRLTPKKSSLDT